MSIRLKLNFVFAVIFCLTELRAVHAINFCDPRLCDNGKTHIACHNNGAFAPICAANAKIITMTPKLRMAILNKHNTLRNRIAMGNLKGFKPAIRMASITWDTKLAKLAVLNVKQCKMQHDECRKTWKYRKAGQNLANTKGKGLSTNVKALAMEYIQMWFDEYKYVNMKVINSYQNIGNIKDYGHFTTLVQEKNCRVGCAILRQTKDGIPYQLMACNYAFTSVFGKAVYRSGPTASKCSTGKNKRFPGLCSTAEKYNLKDGSY